MIWLYWNIWIVHTSSYSVLIVVNRERVCKHFDIDNDDAPASEKSRDKFASREAAAGAKRERPLRVSAPSQIHFLSRPDAVGNSGSPIDGVWMCGVDACVRVPARIWRQNDFLSRDCARIAVVDNSNCSHGDAALRRCVFQLIDKKPNSNNWLKFLFNNAVKFYGWYAMYASVAPRLYRHREQITSINFPYAGIEGASISASSRPDVVVGGGGSWGWQVSK